MTGGKGLVEFDKAPLQIGNEYRVSHAGERSLEDIHRALHVHGPELGVRDPLLAVEGRDMVDNLTAVGRREEGAGVVATMLIRRGSLFVGDVVIASHYVQHDMDASPLFARWEVPGYGVANLPCDAPLTALLHQASQRSMAASFPQTRVHCGLIASGDQFISCAQGVQALRQALHSAGHPVLAVEMEGAAVAQVCTDYAIAFAAMRSISDRADDSAHGDFSHFVQHVASRYADSILSELLHSL